jgi:hypothetical protein
MTRRKLRDRRYGTDRRSFNYTKHIPERRSGNGRRILEGNRRRGPKDRRKMFITEYEPDRRGVPQGFPSWGVWRAS